MIRKVNRSLIPDELPTQLYISDQPTKKKSLMMNKRLKQAYRSRGVKESAIEMRQSYSEYFDDKKCFNHLQKSGTKGVYKCPKTKTHQKFYSDIFNIKASQHHASSQAKDSKKMDINVLQQNLVVSRQRYSSEIKPNILEKQRMIYRTVRELNKIIKFRIFTNKNRQSQDSSPEYHLLSDQHSSQLKRSELKIIYDEAATPKIMNQQNFNFQQSNGQINNNKMEIETNGKHKQTRCKSLNSQKKHIKYKLMENEQDQLFWHENKRNNIDINPYTNQKYMHLNAIKKRQVEVTKGKVGGRWGSGYYNSIQFSIIKPFEIKSMKLASRNQIRQFMERKKHFQKRQYNQILNKIKKNSDIVQHAHVDMRKSEASLVVRKTKLAKQQKVDRNIQFIDPWQIEDEKTQIGELL